MKRRHERRPRVEGLEERVALSNAAVITDMGNFVLIETHGADHAHFEKGPDAGGGGGALVYRQDPGAKQVVVTPSGNYNVVPN